MSSLPIYVRIQSEYFEHDSSRYRLGITQNTLVQSLKHQTDKDFRVVLEQSPMDPYWTRRQKSFSNISEVQPTCPHIEVNVGDDDFLSPSFIAHCRSVPEHQENTFLTFPNGYIFHEGKLRVWRGRDDFVVVTMWAKHGAHVGKSVEVNTDPGWIYIRHQMNSTVIPPKLMAGAQVNGLKWPGWKENVVGKYCSLQVKTATANGCTLHPTKSKSVIYAQGSARRK